MARFDSGRSIAMNLVQATGLMLVLLAAASHPGPAPSAGTSAHGASAAAKQAPEKPGGAAGRA